MINLDYEEIQDPEEVPHSEGNKVKMNKCYDHYRGITMQDCIAYGHLKN